MFLFLWMEDINLQVIEYKTQRVRRETKKTNLVKDRLNQLKYLEGVN